MRFYEFISRKQFAYEKHRPIQLDIAGRVESLHNQLMDVSAPLNAKDRKTAERNLVRYTAKLQKVAKLVEECHLDNHDKLAEAYLDTLPNTVKTIVLHPKLGFSMTEIPDLSRFKYLRTLIFSGNERLTSKGGERIPVTVKTLDCYRTDFEEAEFLARLVNLETLILAGNHRLRDLPDLTVLRNLKTVNIVNIREFEIRRIPTMPTTLMWFICPFNPRYHVHFATHFWYTKYPAQYLAHIERANRLFPVLAEIPEASAKLRMHPNRIARLIESGELELNNDAWNDL